jgi:excisionase family DNA binding protein
MKTPRSETAFTPPSARRSALPLPRAWAPLAADSPPVSTPRTEPLLDLGTVAFRLGVSLKTVRRMIELGELAVHRINRLLRVSEADLQHYVAARRQSPSKEVM